MGEPRPGVLPHRLRAHRRRRDSGIIARTKEGTTMSSIAGTQPVALLVGRILLSTIFVIAGTRKIMAYAMTAGYFAKLGFPMPDAMVAIAILFEVGGGLMLLVGWKARWAALGLALFTLIAA